MDWDGVLRFSMRTPTIQVYKLYQNMMWWVRCTRYLLTDNFPISSKLWSSYFQSTEGISVVLGLTYWGRLTHICISKLTIIGSDNGLSSDRHQAIIWTNTGIWLIRTIGTNFSDILNEIHTFSFTKMYLTMSYEKWRPFCVSLNMLRLKLNRWVSVIMGPVTHKDRLPSFCLVPLFSQMLWSL